MKKRSVLLAVRLSDTQRTVVGYFALLFSILCVIVSCATTTYSYLQHVFMDDISLLVRGYRASDVLLTISIIGSLSGTVYAIGCYVCFRMTASGDRKGYNGWLMAYIVTMIIVVFALGYATYQCYTGLNRRMVKRSLQTDLLAAMKNYSNVAAEKSRIDRMQVNFKCCGSQSFEDWWKIQWCTTWIDPNQITRHRSQSGLFLKDDVPFSCCDPSVLRPCVHQAMRDKTRHAKYPVGGSTLYKVGCSVAVYLHAAAVGSWVLCGLATLACLTVVLVVTCRYLQTSVSEALHAGDVLLSSRGYLLSFGQRRAPGTRAPPPSPVTQPSSPQSPDRGEKVAKVDDAKRRRRRRRNRNKSNREQQNNSAVLSELVEELLSDRASQWSVNTDLELIAEQLAPSPLSDRTLPTSDDGGTVRDLAPAMRPATSRGISSDSSRLSVDSSCVSSSSPAPRLQENWNSNANAEFHSSRSVRCIRPAATPLTAHVALDRNEKDRIIPRSNFSATWQERKYPTLSKTRRRSTSRSRSIANSQRLKRTRGTEHSYSEVLKSGEVKQRKRSNSGGISLDQPSALRRVEQLDQTKTHRAMDHRQTERKRDVHSKSSSGSHSTSGSVLLVSSSLDYFSKTSRTETRQHPSPNAKPSREMDCVCPTTKSIGSLETYSTEGRSSEWSTVSCRTVDDGSLSQSKRITSTRRRGPDDASTAAILSLSNYLERHSGGVLMSTESCGGEARSCRSKKSSKTTQRSSLSTARRALPDGIMYRTKEMTSESKNGRSSGDSWLTVSCRTLSRPPSAAIRGERILEDERACFSTGRTTSEQVRRTNNCNAALKRRRRTSEMQRRVAKNLRHVNSDRYSSSTTSSRTTGQASCDSRSTTVTRSASGTKYKKSSITSAFPSPLVHAVVDAIQLRLGESLPNTTSDHFRLHSTTPPGGHFGRALSDRDKPASAKPRRRGASVHRGGSSQHVTHSLKTSVHTVPGHWSMGQSDRRRSDAL